MERGWGALMGCWGGLSVNCGERHNHLLCQYAGTNTEAWTVCTTPEMDLIGVRNQGNTTPCCMYAMHYKVYSSF
uniref:Uncharacterized protein n=1 Tax=Oryza meridionalis TaxID=40149 RepID=A0A0E0E3M8_9ORYZ